MRGRYRAKGHPARATADRPLDSGQRRPRGTEVNLQQETAALKNGGPVTGMIRTALREMEGLSPVPGDPA